ncbi:MAG: ABC-F family ATP-binding cassette domain-containing protein [Saprospiraceae bacterium]|nr:ABC-F family ATP-binding cassette domain-containing protein [Saprospiraceae bacterium]MDW8228626.1 ABC-F family ATP-binding cassette domain-containing protein [Saprospiraceae bacterium]
MNFLTLENVTKTYGEKVLFRNISLHIDKGQKIGLIAKNGTGKSTLLRVIAGLEGSEGENARILLRKDIRIGWLEQEPTFPPNIDVLTAALDPANPMVRVVQRYERALAHPENTEELQEAMAQMDLHHAWSFEARVKEMLYRFRLEDFTQQVGSLSGGQQKRLALAKILLEDPDFLILDEPTNHLDVEMIEWLEEYLQQPGITLFMVTHDRYFLENVCDSIIELDGGQLRRYSGSYADYLEKKALREEVEATTYERQSKLLKRELEWVRRSPAARTTKAKARVDAYYERKEANEALRKKPEEMTIAIKENWLGSKVVELHNVSKSFGGKKLLENFTYKFKRRERVGIVGPNGSGKSTFLDILTGALPPDTGKVVIGDTIVFGHYRQEGIRLPEDKRVIEVVRDIADYIPLEKGKELSAAQLLERFLFTRPQQQVYVSQLSGGERRRLYLLTVLMKNPNFLILDEPTNDLDVLTLQVLEDFLEDYPGCLVIVTHDRYFMDRLVEHLFVFEGNGKIKDFNGTYAEYRALKRTEAANARPATPAETPKPATPAAPGLSNAERNELKRLEKDMAALERRKQEILQRFNSADLTPADINRLSEELGILQKTLEEKELKWLELAERAG